MQNEERNKLIDKVVKTFNTFKGSHLALHFTTGTGKTNCCLQAIKSKYQKGERICVITFTLSGRDDFKREVDQWWPEAKDFITYRTYNYYYYVRPDDQKLFNYDYVVLDEYHHSSPLFFNNAFVIPSSLPDDIKEIFKGLRLDRIKKPKNLIALSATPADNLIASQIITKKLFVGIRHAIAKNIVSSYEIIPVEIECSLQVKEKITNLYKAIKRESVYDVFGYNRLYNYLSNYKESKIDFSDLGGKSLIFCKNKEQADRVCTHSVHYKNPKSKENLRKFNDGEIQTLSCVDSLNESVNISNLEAIHIIQGSKSFRKLAQRIGRVIRYRENHVGLVYYYYIKGTVDESFYRKNMSFLNDTKNENTD